MIKILVWLKANGHLVTLVALLVSAILVGHAVIKKIDRRDANLADVLQGKLTEAQREMMAADAEIGKLQGDLEDRDELQDEADRLLRENKEWAKVASRYKLKADSLTKIIAESKTSRENVSGEGGATVSETPQGEKVIAWRFADGRLDLTTPDVMTKPPIASYSLYQRFSITELTLRDESGLRVPFVRIAEIDGDGKVIGEAKVVEGSEKFSLPGGHWYDHIILAADAGVVIDAKRRISVPVRGRVGYRATVGFPWRVYAEPFAAVEEMKLQYGAGAFGGFEY